MDGHDKKILPRPETEVSFDLVKDRLQSIGGYDPSIKVFFLPRYKLKGAALSILPVEILTSNLQCV